METNELITNTENQEQSFEVVDTPYINKEEYEKPKSSLKRIAAALIDFFFFIVTAAGLYTLSVYTIFPKTGYAEAAETINNTYHDSQLFLVINGNLALVSNYYDDTKTPEENYEDKIVYYYTHDERAIADGKYEEYIQAKIDSEYFIYDGTTFTAKEDVSLDTLKNFYAQQYKVAYLYLFDSPVLKAASKVTFNIVLVNLLSIVTISSLIWYIVVPAIEKKGRTLGYHWLGLYVVKKNSEELQSKKMVLIRSALFVLLTYILGVIIYCFTSNISLVISPMAINLIFILCLPRSNTIHDIITKSLVYKKAKDL